MGAVEKNQGDNGFRGVNPSNSNWKNKWSLQEKGILEQKGILEEKGRGDGGYRRRKDE